MDSPIKINIITNTFGTYHRQDVAVDSLLHLKSLYPDIIDIYDLQFADEAVVNYDKLITLPVLNESSLTYIPEATKKLPLVFEMLEKGADISTDDENTWILWVNSDCVMLPRLIDSIISDKPDMKCFSRVDIEDVKDFTEILEQGVKFIRTEIAGFDSSAINVKWFNENFDLFSEPYLLGKPIFDVIMAGISKIYGRANDLLGNDLPPYLVHIWHGNASVTTECPEQQWNLQLAKKNRLHQLLDNIMFLNLQFNLCRRKPFGAFLEVNEDEKQKELMLFDILNVNTQNRIKII